MTTVIKPLEVRLPVCPNPTCNRVGKLPLDSYGGRSYCPGGKKNLHKRTRMEPRVFKEVQE